jgi:hypothetical protein
MGLQQPREIPQGTIRRSSTRDQDKPDKAAYTIDSSFLFILRLLGSGEDD